VFIVESVPVINKRLREHFGLRSEKAYFRLTWPNDEFEVRRTNKTPEGWTLLHPEFRKVHKYEKWRWGCWVLERLSEVPIVNLKELADTALSYEPIWTFEKGQPPAWAPVKFLITTLLEQARSAGVYKKYKHPLEGLTTEELKESKKLELEAIERELFGNETRIGDALAHEHGVGYTTSKIMLTDGEGNGKNTH